MFEGDRLESESLLLGLILASDLTGFLIRTSRDPANIPLLLVLEALLKMVSSGLVSNVPDLAGAVWTTTPLPPLEAQPVLGSHSRNLQGGRTNQAICASLDLPHPSTGRSGAQCLPGESQAAFKLIGSQWGRGSSVESSRWL